MDPLAHTLVGATLGETRLNRSTPLARTALLIAANLPDIDGVCSLWGPDVMLGCRRGHTHGILAVVVLPLVVTGLFCLVDRFFRVPRGRPPVVPRAIFGLSLLGVATHPFLDWLNNYGIRLLMPFSGEWFYGDALFIMDPWLWLLAACAVVAGQSASRSSVASWTVLGVLTSALVLSTGFVPLAAKLVWLLGLAAVVILRVSGCGEAGVPRLAAAALGTMGLYVIAMVAGSALAREQARAWYREHGIEAGTVMAGPVPARPFVRDVIVKAGEHYHFAELNWLGDPIFRPARPAMPVGDGPIPRAALAQLPGLRTWIRFPAFETVEVEDGYEVRIRDVRYDRQGTGLGSAVVRVPRSAAGAPEGPEEIVE